MGTASVAQGLVTNQAVFEFVSISKQNVSQRDAFNPNLKYLEPPKLVLFICMVFIFSVYYLRWERPHMALFEF